MTENLSGERYLILGEIGRGRRAAVFEARDTLLDRRVAIKRALRTQDEPLLLEEARRLARVGSARVVRLLDVLQGPPFGLVLELFEGCTLRERARDSAPIPAVEAARLVEQLLESVVDLHAAGLVHGDIKPENIACPASGGPLRLLDVGALGDATALYAAPEASPGRPAGPGDDVYAAAIVAFELVCGRPPFDATDAAELAVRKRNQDAPTATSVGATPGPEVESWLARALARDPASRHGDAAAALAAWRQAATAFAAPRTSLGSGVLLHPEIAARAAALFEKQRSEGRGDILVVAGGAGIGKSFLARAWAAAARTSGLDCVEVRSSAGVPRRPFATWNLATRGLLLCRPRPVRSRRDEAAQQERVLRSLRQRPVALTADDLAGCDAATRRLVLRILELAPSLHLVALVTLDPGQRGRAARSVRAAIASIGAEIATCHDPAAETWRPFINAVLEGHNVTEALVSYVRERSGGNPAFALHVLAALRDRGALQRTGEAWIFRPELAGDDVPIGISQALEDRLQDIPIATRELLETSAVMDGRCVPEVLARCAGMSVQAVIDALHAAGEERGLVRRSGSAYEFTMPLLASHLRQRLAPERQRALHAAIAAAFADAGIHDDDALGAHLYHAGEPGRALEHLERAGRAALERGDAATALASLDLACAAADLGLEDESQARRRADLGLARAGALQRLAAWPAASEELERTVVTARAWGLDDAESRALAAFGDIEYAQSRFEAAIERWLEAQVCAARLGDERALHELELKVGNVHFETGDLVGAGEEYARALDWATQRGDLDLEARAAHNVALVESIQGRKEHAVHFFNRSLERFRSLGRSDAVARIYHNIGQIYLELGNWAEARNFFQRSMVESEKSGQDALHAAASLDSAEASLQLGARAEASEAVASALATSRERGDEVGVASAYRLQAALAAASGDTAAAEARLLESIDMLSRLGQALQLGLCWKDLGAVRLATGRTTAAAAALHEAHRVFVSLDATQHVAEVEALRARCGEGASCRA